MRDAVRAARTAFPGWAAKTAMNRGQVLYRVAELMEGRRDQFVAEVAAAEGLREARAAEVVDRAIDRWVWYAGWADKITQILGSAQPGRGAVLQLHDPRADRGRRRGRARDVVAAGARSAGWRRRSCPGNAVVLLASETPAAAGHHAERGPRDLRRAGRRRQHPDRAPEGAGPGAGRATSTSTRSTPGASPTTCALETEQLAADDIKRLSRRPTTIKEARFDWLDDRAAERPEWIAAFLEMKTVWHPIGV